jgi:hypothetical protein
LLACLTVIVTTAAFLRAADDTTRLLRFPATNDQAITFSYGGQLYPVAADGGTARRLTDAPGYAIFPRYSSDGAQLAFTAQYDGNTEVYVMPASGGSPKRLTTSATLDRDDLADRMGPNNIVFGWRHTAAEVVFRSRWHSFNPFIGQLYTVALEGDVPTQLPVPLPPPQPAPQPPHFARHFIDGSPSCLTRASVAARPLGHRDRCSRTFDGSAGFRCRRSGAASHSLPDRRHPGQPFPTSRPTGSGRTLHDRPPLDLMTRAPKNTSGSRPWPCPPCRGTARASSMAE